MLWSLNKRLSKIRNENSRYELETLLNKQVPHVLTRLATNCASMLSVIVNAPVHVSVKCLNGDVIWTQSRSRSESLSIRVEALDFFIVTENTAFQQIIEGKVKYYLCNGLDKEAGYKNINKNYKKFYNNTLVIPFHSRVEPKNIMLFVCADSMTGEFDDKECVEIIETIGLQMQRIIQLQQELSSTRKAPVSQQT